MPPISPSASWKASRMSQHSTVWVGSCVCERHVFGESSLQEGQCDLGMLLLQHRLIRWPGDIWDKESKSPRALTTPSPLLGLPWSL